MGDGSSKSREQRTQRVRKNPNKGKYGGVP